MNADPMIDLVIPVHDASRPIARAVTSVLASGLSVPSELRISVVCHNLPVNDVAIALGDLVEHVRLLSLDDGEPSPAGPFMHGLRSATAAFVSIMGSDDALEPGALRAWLDAARAGDLTALIPPERHAAGGKVATPPIRPFRRGSLHPLKDRLAYRTAPLGLFKRTMIDELGLDMPSRLRGGSDQLFGLKLWFSGRRIGYGRGLPHYIVGADAKTRVTLTVRRAEDELRAVRELVTDAWVRDLQVRSRTAIVTKSARVHLFSAALVRTRSDRWNDEDRAYIADLISVFATVAPGFRRAMSLADRRLLDALSTGTASVDELARLLASRQRFGHPLTVLTRHVGGLLATDGPLRFMIAARLL